MTDADLDPARWAFVRAFRRPAPRVFDWSSVEALTACSREVARRQALLLPGLVAQWDRILADVDGEPMRHDWRSFRPLRLSREEDWSDWLQELLERSESGRFAAALLTREPGGCARPTVRREVTLAHRRLDLLIGWRDGTFTHVEVKVGDLAFEKTFETAALNRAALAGKHCDDWVLLPRGDLHAWTATATGVDREGIVRSITWHDVALALRVALSSDGERATWRVWAAAFLGAVHQTLLGHPALAAEQRHQAVAVAELIDIMEAGIDGAR